MSTRSELELTPNRSLVLSWTDDSRNSVVRFVGKQNSDLYQLFCGSYISLLLDSPVDSDKPVKVLRRFFYNLVYTSPRDLIIHYSSLADEILMTMNITSDYTLTGEFLDEMKDTPVFREYLHFYKTGDPLTLKFLLSFLYFGKKMDFIDNNLESVAFRDWLEIEEDMADFSIPLEITDHLKIIISQVLCDFDDSTFLPRHGPGYTAEGLIDPNDKLDHLSLDEKSAHTFSDTSFGRVSVDRCALYPWLGKDRCEQVGKLRFVPKNIKTMRSICMEPISRMFLQQEVSRWVINAMGTSPFKYLIDFHDQSFNQQYAVGGSSCYSSDTIDLSSASDRVHIELVKRIFPRKVLFYLLGTRTSIVDTKNGRRKLNKFAPMGSALCFPIESILFASISILGYLMHYYECISLGNPSEDWYYLYHISDFIRMMHSNPEEMSSRLLRPRIYGDDIICDYRITDNILILLTQCGLKINSAKSFIGGTPFRESCGVYAYNGTDVSPTLFRVPSFKRRVNSRTFASVIDMINRSGDFSYHHLRSYLINFLRRCRVEGIHGDVSSSIPFTSSKSDFGIFSLYLHPPKRIRYNVPLQREEKRVLIIRPFGGRRIPSEYSEAYSYDQWMRARIHGGSSEINFSAPRLRPRTSRIRLGWTPV